MGFIRNVGSSPTLGLTASFTQAVTVNTTGTAALAANTRRQLGVWVNTETASIICLVGSTIDNATMRVAPPGATNSPQPFFVPGTGPVYVKAGSGIINVSFMEY